MTNTTGNVTCLLCGANAETRYHGLPGYAAGLHFDICSCPACTAAFALPQTVPDNLYDAIYRNIDIIPGYERYPRYTQRVASHDKPLDFLANSEPAYWAVAHHLRQRRGGNKEQPRILDVGCGQGYLPYALAREGYDVLGLDVSEPVVAQARQQFGDLFVSGDLHDFASHNPGSFDCVLLCEIAEHVPDLCELVRSAADLLSNDGSLLLTTPNRSFYPGFVLWETELPPVHLWWLGEDSLQMLAQKLDLCVNFIDLSAYYASHYCAVDMNLPRRQPTRRPVFDEQMRVIPQKPSSSPPWHAWVRSVAGHLGLLNFAKHTYNALKGYRRCVDRGPSLCAVLRRTGP